MNRRQIIAALAATPAGLMMPQTVRAAHPAISAPDGIAIRGADTVCYLTLSSYVPGLAELSIVWRGARWQFSRPETMASFEMDPTAYSPQFGGYCTLALASGMLSHSDPRAFLLHEGAVYLFKSAGALSRAQGNLDRTLSAALMNWPAFLDG